MTDGGRLETSQRCPPSRRLGACEFGAGPDADRHVKPLIQFAVEGSLSGAYSHSPADLMFVARNPRLLATPLRRSVVGDAGQRLLREH